MRKLLIIKILFLFFINKSTAQSCVIITEPPVNNAGIGTNATVCKANSGLPVIDLSNVLTGEDSGGAWNVASGSENPGTAFSVVTGIFDPNNLPSGIYIFQYFVGTNSCNDSEEIRIEIEACCANIICSPTSVRKL